MFGTYFQQIDDAPPDIAWFERLWLSTLVVTVIITITMIDWSVQNSGLTLPFYSPPCAFAGLI